MNAVRVVAVTGASGFVGRELCRRLIAGGLRVRAIVRSRALPSDLERVGVDVVRVVDLAAEVPPEVCVGADALVHLAARVHRPGEHGPSAEAAYRHENVDATAALARAAVAAGVRRFVLVSSIKAVGEASSGIPIPPTAVPQPRDPYGRSKLAAEHALSEISGRTGIEAVVVRPPLVYGPEVGANFRQLVAWVARGAPLPFGSVNNRRSLVSVWNLADVLTRTLEQPVAAGQTFHVADDRSVSTAELVRLVAKGLGRPVPLVRFPPRVLDISLRMLGRGAIADRLLGSLEVDDSQTRRLLHWAPPVTVDDGIVRSVREMSR
jgi:nucleoside-diphosphate-sugar epimerase